MVDMKRAAECPDQIKKEICINKMLSHENVVKFYGHRREGTIQYLFLEYCSGGELFDRIGNNRCLQSREVGVRLWGNVFSSIAGLDLLRIASWYSIGSPNSSKFRKHVEWHSQLLFHIVELIPSLFAKALNFLLGFLHASCVLSFGCSVALSPGEGVHLQIKMDDSIILQSWKGVLA